MCDRCSNVAAKYMETSTVWPLSHADWAQHLDVMMLITWWPVLHVSQTAKTCCYLKTHLFLVLFPLLPIFPHVRTVCDISLVSPHTDNLIHFSKRFCGKVSRNAPEEWFVVVSDVRVLICTLFLSHLCCRALKLSLFGPELLFFNDRSNLPVHADAIHVGSFTAHALRYTIA